MAISGNTGLLQVDADGSGTYSTIAELTDWSVGVAGEQIEVSAMGNAYKEFLGGQYSWTLSASMKYVEDDAAQELILTSIQTGAAMYIKLWHTSSSGTGSGDYWSGAVINGSLDTSATLNDAVNVSFSAQGSGALTYTNA
jgi:predicted secreted protein